MHTPPLSETEEIQLGNMLDSLDSFEFDLGETQQIRDMADRTQSTPYTLSVTLPMQMYHGFLARAESHHQTPDRYLRELITSR